MTFVDLGPFNSKGELDHHNYLMSLKPTVYQHVDYFLYNNRKAIATGAAVGGVFALGIFMSSQIDKRQRAKEQLLHAERDAKLRQAAKHYNDLHSESLMRSIMPSRVSPYAISDADLKALIAEYDFIVFNESQDPTSDLCLRLMAAVQTTSKPE